MSYPYEPSYPVSPRAQRLEEPAYRAAGDASGRLQGGMVDDLQSAKGDDSHAHKVTGDFELGTEYTIRFEAANGKVRYWYNGEPVPHSIGSTTQVIVDVIAPSAIWSGHPQQQVLPVGDVAAERQ